MTSPAGPTATAGDVVVGADGVARCRWGASTADYQLYHDTEWGRPVREDNGLFERLVLEAFQSGLSWLTILRKRSAFRLAFAGFDIETVAGFGAADVQRLLGDTGIVRNRAKIEAAIANARAAMDLPGGRTGGPDQPAGRTGGSDQPGGLAELVWSFAPPGRPRPRTLAEVPATTVESTALAKALKGHGFRFIGPTTAYALMQATGMVDDHLVDCHAVNAAVTVDQVIGLTPRR